MSMTTRATTPAEQVARFRASLRETVKQEFDYAAQAASEVASSCEQLSDMDQDSGDADNAAGDVLDSLERALALRSYAKVLDEMLADERTSGLLDVLASAADAGVHDLARDTGDPTYRWLSLRLTPQMRQWVLDRHYATQTSRDLDAAHEQLLALAPPAIELLMQAVWAPMHCRVAA
jgi:hypothetical protein